MNQSQDAWTDKINETRSISASLTTHTAIALAQLLLFSMAMYGWILHIAPILGPIAFFIASFLAWGSLRVNSTWLLLFLLAISWCTQGTPGRSQAWFESIQLAAWAACLFAWRTHYHSLHYNIVHQLLSSQAAASARPPSSQPAASARDLLSPPAASATDHAPAPTFAAFFAQLAISSGTTLLLATGFAVLSAILLGKNPMLEGRRGWSRWVQGLEGTLWPNPELLLACIAIAILLREWEWRRLGPDEAGIAIRAQAARWLYPDMKRIVRFSRRYQASQESSATQKHNSEFDEVD